jgi:hypothetical protein
MERGLEMEDLVAADLAGTALRLPDMVQVFQVRVTTVVLVVKCGLHSVAVAVAVQERSVAVQEWSVACFITLRRLAGQEVLV